MFPSKTLVGADDRLRRERGIEIPSATLDGDLHQTFTLVIVSQNVRVSELTGARYRITVYRRPVIVQNFLQRQPLLRIK